ncbi:transglycosylase SLT domain-containing protein [Conexibacter sp. W3-3-2]|uniref:lytic transglycosylase domain-containing protein n=1 Tax=Conexibacter sp. W3-3-2 TaxID=2675227 RepID=UPI0012B7115B|nr:lytic transglycosylase domain-containing protein [Conexibacter sp. W3-3-2]MTD43855.1 transglycosylase SLT domain-containing protein [Conexibacter sp. W3-3-2]
MSDTVLRWAGLYEEASKAYGIPASVLAGLVQIESGGRPGLTSSANAQGITQFIPGTAAQYNVDVRPGRERSQVMGAARYLRDLGFSRDPTKALASYNAGPGNYRAGLGYARKVLGASQSYKTLDTPGAAATGIAGVTASGALDLGTAAGGNATAGVDNAPIFLTDDRKAAMGRAALWLGLLVAGAALIGVGLTRATGARPSSLASAATPVGRVAKAATARRAAKATTETAA